MVRNVMRFHSEHHSGGPARRRIGNNRNVRAGGHHQKPPRNLSQFSISTWLEEVSCECYRLIREQEEALLG
jgi:hypothetical protein